MNENLNLCEILKGHEGETFYSHSFGEVKLSYISSIQYIKIDYGESVYQLTPDGKIYEKGELDLFPSKDQRDWNKWVEEQKSKVPKTWSEYSKIVPPKTTNDYKDYPFAVQNLILGEKM